MDFLLTPKSVELKHLILSVDFAQTHGELREIIVLVRRKAPRARQRHRTVGIARVTHVWLRGARH